MVTNSNEMGAGIAFAAADDLELVNAFPNKFTEYICVILLVRDFEFVVLIPAIDVSKWRDSLF